MASASLVPKNGAIALTGYLADFASFSVKSQQSVENVTPYGANTCSKNVGSGTPDFTFNVGAFALAHAANTPLGLPALSGTGASATYTLDTGVTETGTCIVESISVSHRRMGGAVPVAFQLKNAGEIVEAWAVS